jgi:hypothetical protein
LANVFISYARRDKDRVARLTEALEGEGLSVWWDSDLVPGRRYRTIIAEQLALADSVIVVWTAAALESDFVQDEAEDGRLRGVLIPVTLEPVRPPAGFRQVQAADLSQWTGSPQHPDFRTLVFAVRSLVQVADAARRNEVRPAPGQVVAAPPVAPEEPAPEEPGPEESAPATPRSLPLNDDAQPAASVEPPPATVDAPSAPTVPSAAIPEDTPPVAAQASPTAESSPATLQAAVEHARPAAAEVSAGAADAPTIPDAVAAPQPPARRTLSERLVAIAFSWKWWLAGAAALVVSAFAVDAAVTLFAVAPLAAAALAAAGRRANFAMHTRVWLTWLSMAGGSLIALLYAFGAAGEGALHLMAGLVVIFIFVGSCLFVPLAALALLVRAVSRRPPAVAAAPAPGAEARPTP